MAFTPTEMQKTLSPTDPSEALAQQRVAQVLSEVQTMLARITDSSVREELSRAAGGIETQLRAGIRPDQMQGMLMQVEQLRGAANHGAQTQTQRATSQAVLNGVLLTAAAEERIRIRSQQINASNIREFIGTYFDPSEGLDPEMQARITDNVAKILLDSPTMAQWNALPQAVRGEAARITEMANEKLTQMQSDPRYESYARTLARMQRTRMVGTEEERGLIEAIANGSVTAQEAESQFHQLRHAKADRAERVGPRIAEGLKPGSLEVLQQMGLAQGNRLDMRDIFRRGDEYPENWGERFRQYRGTDPSTWPVEIRQEHAVREAAHAAITASSVEDVMALGLQIERRQGRDLDVQGQALLEQSQELYALMLDRSAPTADRRAAVENYLMVSNRAFSGASPYVRDQTVSKVLASMDANPHMYTSGDYDRNTRSQFAVSVSNYERSTLDAYARKEGEVASKAVLDQAKDWSKTIEGLIGRYNNAPRPAPEKTEASCAAIVPPQPVAAVAVPATEVFDPVADMQLQALTPIAPVVVQPVAPAVEMGPADPRAEGSQGRWDNLYKNAMENRLEKAFEGHDMTQIVAVLGPLLNEHNVGRQDYISIHEAENALAAIGVTANHLSAALTLNDVAAALTPNAGPRTGPETGRNT